MLEEEVSGQQQKATLVKGLIFPDIAPQGVMTPKATSEPNPFDPLSQPVQPVAQRPQTTATQGNPYANAPGPTTSYPRGRAVSHSGDEVPLELKGGFNFAAFWFTWIWGLNHRAYWTLSIFLALTLQITGGMTGNLFLVGAGWICWLVLKIIFGIKGNEAAWRSDRFSFVEDCLECQRIWRNWALVFFTLWLVPVLAAIILPVIAQMQRG